MNASSSMPTMMKPPEERHRRSGLAIGGAVQYVFENIEQARFDKLKRLNALVSEDATLKAVILETDEATQRDDLSRRQESLGADLVIVTNSEGALLARTDDAGRPGQDLAPWPCSSPDTSSTIASPATGGSRG